MNDLWTVEDQARRLEEVATPDPDPSTPSLRGALDAALGHRGRALQTHSFVWGPPSWGGVRWKPADQDLYSFERSLTITVQDRVAGEVSPEIKLWLPWLCSEAAAATAPATVRLGAHRGLFAGTPRVCPHVAMRAPGLHFVRSDQSARPSYRVDLVPDYGRSLRFTLTPDSVQGPVTEYRTSSRTPPPRFTEANELMETLDAALPVAGFFWLPGTRSAVTERWGRAGTDTAAAAISGTLLSLRGADRAQALTELDRRLWRIEAYPDLLIRALHTGMAAAVGVLARTAETSFTDERAAATMTLHVRAQVNDLVRGRGRYAGTTAPLAGTNILDRMEEHRQVTFIGPGGFSTRTATRGRLDLRALPENWKGVLCPVQTPESQKVGLIRHLARSYHSSADLSSGDRGESDGPEELSAAVSLIPFLNHNDPTRSSIGSKMFKQALIPAGAHPPAIRTGFERVIAAETVTRAPMTGTVIRVGQDALTLLDLDGLEHEVPLVEAGAWPAPANRLTLAPGIAAGTDVRNGEVLAAPEGVDLGGAEPGEVTPELALGVDAVTAVLPWHGYNFEDAIVVSESFAARMMTHDYVEVARSVPNGYRPVRRLSPDTAQDMPEVQAGQPLLDLVPDTGATAEHPAVTLHSPARGRLHVWEDPADPWFVEYVQHRPRTTAAVQGTGESLMEVRLWIRVARPLAVGDKLTNRYSGKGVVSLILPDSQMPRPQDPVGGEGGCAEIIINPLGILRRQNFGAVLELNRSLVMMARGETAPVTVGRETDVRSLGSELEEAGYPGGLVRLADGSGRVGPAEGSLFGRMNIMKLVHTAHSRASSHSDSHASPITGQPVRNKSFGTHRWRGAAQRIGEMEMWALSAMGASDTLADIFTARGTGDKELRGPGFMPAGLRSTAAHLRLAGIHLLAQTGGTDGSAPAYTDLAEDDGSTQPGTVTAFHLGWAGDSEPALHPQTDVFAALGGEGGEPLKSMAFVKQVIRDMYEATLPGAESADGSGERPAYARHSVYMIELGTPVEHPWTGWRDGGRVELPEISCLPVPAASLLAGTDDILLVRLQAILYADIQYRAQAAWEERKTRPPGHDSRYWHGQLRERVKAYLGAAQDPAPGSVAARLSGKKGLLRHNLLGSAVIRSGRAVIVPDPLRDIESIGMPAWMARDLGVDGDGPSLGDVVLFNRQPTLHPYSLVALRADTVDGDALHIHPYLCRAIAGDFDGDTAAVHRPATAKAREEAWRLARPAANLRNSGSGDPLAYLDLDVAVGLLLATGTEQGREALATAISRPVNGQLLPGPLRELGRRISADGVTGIQAGESALKTFHRLMAAGFEHARAWGFSLADLPRLTPDSLAPDGTEDGAAAAMADRLGKHLDAVFHGTAAGTAPCRRVAEAFVSGAGGKPGDMVRLLLDPSAPREAPGDAPDRDGTGESFNILDGIPGEDYFGAAQQSIVKIAEKKLLSPEAGSLTKDLVESAFELMITARQCTAAGPGRDPLTCAQEDGLCARCYGPDARTGALHGIGSRVGILAGMLIGEKSTQLSMKSIHRRGTGEDQVASGVAQLRAALLGGSFAPHLATAKLAVILEATDPPLWAMKSLKGLREHAAAQAPGGGLQALAASAAKHLQVLAACVGEILPSVEPKHAQVILRLQYFRLLAGTAEGIPGDAGLGRAAERGQIQPLIPGVRAGARTASGAWDFSAFPAPQDPARLKLLAGQFDA